MHGNMVSLIYRQAAGAQSKQQTNRQTKQKAMCREQETGGGVSVGGGVRQGEESERRWSQSGFGSTAGHWNCRQTTVEALRQPV